MAEPQDQMLLENILSIIWGEKLPRKRTTSKYYINRSIWIEDRRSPNNKREDKNH